jgi:general secretion pathway protein D
LTGWNYDQSLAAGKGVIAANVNLDLVLQLLVKNLDSRLVSDPTISTRNNRKGNIFAGQNIPRLSKSQTTPEGALTQSFENEDIGINLEITPRINDDDTVVMQVHLKTDQITGETRFGSDILDKRTYTTEVAVKGGQTMVLGGIKLTSDLKIVRNFPILGKAIGWIPVIGWPFRNTDTGVSTSDLYAFITPVVVSSKAEADRLTHKAMKEIGEMEEFSPETDEEDEAESLQETEEEPETESPEGIGAVDPSTPATDS